MKFTDKAKYWWYLKNSDGLIKAAIVLFVVLVLILLASGCDEKAFANSSKPSEAAPETTKRDVEVVAINSDKVYAIYVSDELWDRTFPNYLTTIPLIRELAKLGEKYEVKQVVEITSKWFDANPTRGFIVFVEKKTLPAEEK